MIRAWDLPRQPHGELVPHCNTSISDAEVEYEEKDGSFWHLLYPVKETGEMLELATTRPRDHAG